MVENRRRLILYICDMEFKPWEFENKWKKLWKEKGIYKVANEYSKPKFYVLDMFPYPSGAGLHVGHPLGYIASDIIARAKRMQGYQVLHPMGFDAFGLPAEQYAIQTGIHPNVSTYDNINKYRKQLENIGFNHDPDREIITCDPSYYRWTQWIFLQFYKHYYDIKEQSPKPIAELVKHFEQHGTDSLSAYSQDRLAFSASDWARFTNRQKDDILMSYRLAYRKKSFVNWCEALGTVLANDEVKDGVSERGGYPVEKKPMMQWALRITAYADRLLSDLEDLDWPEALKAMQRNWIGVSTGAQIFFDLADHDEKLEIYTTRPDTIFGASFMVLAPEHPLALKICKPEFIDEVSAFIERCKKRTDLDRQVDIESASGVFTGAYAIHPFNNRKLGIWVSDYVLIDYGAGAIMAVPGHDTRDLAFAKKYQLPIYKVVQLREDDSIESQDGIMIHSDFLNGMDVKTAIDKATTALEEKGVGKFARQYRMRDANFSRQRYWGEPFPIYYDSEGASYCLDENELPLELPYLANLDATHDGTSPLSRIKEWVYAIPDHQRETDTMPGYAGSSWYYLRYMDPDNQHSFASKEALAYWRDVDLYIGGTEHAVGHLMYSRFWHKFLYDLGYVPTKEPFRKLVNQGMILGVIENLLLVKNSQPPHFIDATMLDNYGVDRLIKIPVHIGLVSDYGNRAHLTKEGLTKFISWRPDYHQAIFENSEEKNIVSKLSDGFKISTFSEVGKMSKRYHNVVNPDDVIAQYGADCFRLYEMFLGPIEQSKPWDIKGIDGVFKFLKRLWSLFYGYNGHWQVEKSEPNAEELRALHTCIKKVTSDLEVLSFNTSVSAFMICLNELKRLNCKKDKILLPFIQLLAPFAPFITEELWQAAGCEGSVHHSEFPVHNPSYLITDLVSYPVSINGKKRHEWQVSKSLDKVTLEREVVNLPEIKKWIGGHSIKKIIIVPERMINIVV